MESTPESTDTTEQARDSTAPSRPHPPARTGLSWRGSRGVLPKRSVTTAAFAVISLAIFACGALCLLAVWGYVEQNVSWRAVTSLGIIAACMGAFVVVNNICGQAMTPEPDATTA